MRDADALRKFEDDQIRSSAPDYATGLRIFEALWQEAVDLGVLPSKDPLEGIEIDLRLAERLRVHAAWHASSRRQRT